MKLRTIIAGTGLMLWLAASTAWAVDKPATPGMLGDTDKNGILTVKEIKEERSVLLISLDANKDNKVTIEEFINGLNDDFGKRDKNNDGNLIADEFVVYWCGKAADPKLSNKKSTKKNLVRGSLLKNKDKNRNNQIEPDECVAFWSLRFSAADTNKDSKVDRNEFKELMKRVAGKIDTNKDGVLTIEEYTLSWVGKESADQKSGGSK